MNKWASIPALHAFAEKEWVFSKFWRWQTSHTPPGYYTPTNSPIESYNKDIKKTHTKNERLTVNALSRFLIESIVKYESIHQKPFQWLAVPTEATIRLATSKPFQAMPDGTYIFQSESSSCYRYARLNTIGHPCSCYYYLHKAVCCHVIALSNNLKIKIHGYDPVRCFSNAKKRPGRPKKMVQLFQKNGSYHFVTLFLFADSFLIRF